MSPTVATAAPSAQTPAPAIGSLETVAGPRYCAGRATVDRDASSVRSLAVDRAGQVFFETGRRDLGAVGVVEANGGAQLLASLQRPSGPAGPGTDAGRLAADHRGGVLQIAGNELVRHAPGASTSVVLGAASATAAPAPSANLGGIRSIATDDEGNLFVAEEIGSGSAAFRVRFVNRGPRPITFFGGTPEERTVAPAGVGTLAGDSGRAGSADGGPAVEASLLGGPPALAVLGSRLYVATARPAAATAPSAVGVQLVNLGAEPLSAHGVQLAPGAIGLVAGGGPAGFAGDGGPARSAAFSTLTGIDVDDDGNLYLADQGNNRVRKVDGAGTVTTFAGTGEVGAAGGGFNGNARRATDARLNQPLDVKVGPEGRVYVSDQRNAQVRFVDRSGLIHLAPGLAMGLSWTCTDGTSSSEARGGDGPNGTAVGRGGELYFTTSVSVQRVEPPGQLVTVAGGRRDPTCTPGSGCASGDGGPAADALLQGATGVAAGRGGLYLLDAGRVRFVNLTSRPVETLGVQVAPGAIDTVVAGSAPEDQASAPAPAPKATIALSAVGSVAADANGNLFIADAGTQTLYEVRSDGRVTNLVGAYEPDRGGCCRSPAGVAVDPVGNLYISDRATHRVWVLNRSSRTITAHGRQVAPGGLEAVAGNGTAGVAGDLERAIDAPLQDPTGIAVDRLGSLYIANSGEHTVRKVDAQGIITAVAGTGQFGFNGDGLPAPLSALNSPNDVAVDGCGNLVIVDQGNRRLRRLRIVPECVFAAPPADNAFPAWPMAAGAVALAAIAGAVVAGRRRRGTRRHALKV